MNDPVAMAYQAHYMQLVRLARQFVDDVETAEEVVQEVFVRLQHRSDLADVRYPYLRAAVLNQSRSTLRRRGLIRRKRWALESVPGGGSATDPAIGVAEREQIRVAISRLPRRQKEVVVLRFYEDLSLKEIATTLGITVNATSAALARALDSISTHLGNDS